MFIGSRSSLPSPLLVLMGMVLVSKAALAFRIANTYLVAPEPEAIFLLGGGHQRERATAAFAQNHPDLEIWISSGISRKRSQPIYDQAAIPRERVHRNTQAVDTVTNFTTMVEVLKSRGIRHVYLLTSDFHMARSRTLALLIFGFHGLVVTPIPIPDQRESEPWLKTGRDAFRAILWIITGYSGAPPKIRPKLYQ